MMWMNSKGAVDAEQMHEYVFFRVDETSRSTEASNLFVSALSENLLRRLQLIILPLVTQMKFAWLEIDGGGWGGPFSSSISILI